MSSSRTREPLPTTLIEMFAAQVARTPDAVAVADDDSRCFTYAELDEQVRQLAVRLRANGVGPDVPVGMLLDRSVWLPVALLGIMRAGGAFTPLDLNYPTARIRQILDSISVPVTLTDSEHVRSVVEAGGAAIELPLTDGAPDDVPATVNPENLAAVYHTSGSTGRPKAVACTHAGWVNRMRWMQARHPLRPGDTLLQKTVLTFDDSGVELLWPLFFGARVVMHAPGRAHLDPRAVIDAAIRHRVTHLQFVPGLFDLFLEALSDQDIAELGALRSIGCSGEALPPRLVRRHHERFAGHVELDNTWGVTEASIDSTYHRCGPDDGMDPAAPVPIGVPMTGNTMHVLDVELAPVAEGELGELFIGGVGLARCYLGDPARTAAAFVPDPTGVGTRLYRTGDRGKRRADGALVFVGRDDDQVKVRGVRIELGEVEAALLETPGIADAAVTTFASSGDEKRLAAFVVPATGAEPDPEAVRGHVMTLLAGYAVPDHIELLAKLPRHPNGKLDRKALPIPAVGAGDDCPRPGTEMEELIERMWAAVLGTETVGIDTRFIDAGGNSLIAMRLLSRLRRAFGFPLPLKFVFDNPTIRTAGAELEALILAESH